MASPLQCAAEHEVDPPTGRPVISPEDLAVAAGVLRALAGSIPSHADVLQHPDFFPFIEALKTFTAARRRDGTDSRKSPSPERRDARRAEVLELRAAARARDLELLNRTGLRAGRKRRIAELEAASAAAGVALDDSTVFRAPDGPGDDSISEAAGDGFPLHGHPDTSAAASDATGPVTLSAQGAGTVLSRARRCYVCKRLYVHVHVFYDSMCPVCAAFNYAKRAQSADLSGRVALVTGARVKVGFHVALKLLRAGAAVIATSRFPRDALRRFSAQPDAAAWLPRLTVCELELRDLREVESFCDSLCSSLPRLDIIVNNAAQTVRRPPAYYAAVLRNERTLDGFDSPLLQAALLRGEALAGSSLRTTVHPPLLPPAPPQQTTHLLEDSKASSYTTSPVHSIGGCQFRPSHHADRIAPDDSHAVLDNSDPQLQVGTRLGDSQCTVGAHTASESVPVALAVDPETSVEFPAGLLDAHGQQLDLRKANSWVLPLPAIETTEFAEVFVINAIAPMTINARLWPLLTRGRDGLLSGPVPPSGTPPPSLDDAIAMLEAAAGPHVPRPTTQPAAGAGVTSSASRRRNATASAHGGVSSPVPADACRFIINVSAMEGRFYRTYKHAHHPHTNAAKAALNMMVRTSAADAATSAVFMNAVDTGWVTLEHPAHIAARISAAGFQTPLDEVDAAARVLDPVFAPLAAAQGFPPAGWPIRDTSATSLQSQCKAFPTDTPQASAADTTSTEASHADVASSEPSPTHPCNEGSSPRCVRIPTEKMEGFSTRREVAQPAPGLSASDVRASTGVCAPLFGAFLKDYFAGAW